MTQLFKLQAPGFLTNIDQLADSLSELTYYIVHYFYCKLYIVFTVYLYCK